MASTDNLPTKCQIAHAKEQVRTAMLSLATEIDIALNCCDTIRDAPWVDQLDIEKPVYRLMHAMDKSPTAD